MTKPANATFLDPFRMETKEPPHDSRKTFAFDTTLFGALVHASLSENHEPSFNHRSRYDQLFLEAISSYAVAIRTLGTSRFHLYSLPKQ